MRKPRSSFKEVPIIITVQERLIIASINPHSISRSTGLIADALNDLGFKYLSSPDGTWPDRVSFNKLSNYTAIRAEWNDGTTEELATNGNFFFFG